MRILGIETATVVCGVAVAEGGKILAEQSLHRRNVHAESIMKLIDDVLTQSRTDARDLGGIAVSIGPGSFTGLRIGLSVAKGLAYTLEKPIVAVSTPVSLAQRAVDDGVGTPEQFILVLLDARRDEVYCQLFRASGEIVEPVWEARSMTIGDLIPELGDRQLVVTGDAKEKLREAAAGNARMKSGLTFIEDSVALCSAGTVARLGERILEKGGSENVVTLEPRYVKEFYMKAV